MNIEIVPAWGHEQDIRDLFAEYTAMLIAEDAAFAKYLVQQNYDAELAHLEEKYGEPGGRLYVAYCDGEAAGCVALRQMDAARAEVKRLYVRRAFRGQRLGERLMQTIIADARELGYTALLLDTLPFLTPAIALYRKLGFVVVDPFSESPMSESVYMRLGL